MNNTVWVIFRSSQLWGTELLRIYANHQKARDYVKELKEKDPYFNYIICPKQVIF